MPETLNAVATGPDRPAPLTADEFQEAVRSLIEDAEDHADKNWKIARIDGWARYNGKVDLITKEGDDTSIAYEIRDTTRQLLGEIMEQLAGGDEPAEYHTRDPDKHALCREATRLAEAIFWEGGGWRGLMDGVMHAAIGRLGMFKVYKEEKWKFEDSEFADKPPEWVDELENEQGPPGVVILTAHEHMENGLDELGQPISYVRAVSGTTRRYFIEAKHRITAPDPAEIFCSQAVHADEALCIGQRSVARMGFLMGMGFTVEELQKINTGFDDRTRQERTERMGETTQTRNDHGTWALRSVDLYEAYCLLDADGDGFLERWKVILAGSDKTVLRAHMTKDQPYILCPLIPSPHTIQGLAVPDVMRDVQEFRTFMVRALRENVSLQSNPMLFGSGTLNWTQLQNIKKHKVVNEVTPGAVRWFTAPSMVGEALPVLDWLKSVRAERIGVDPSSMGLQPDQLTGVAAVAVAGAQSAAARQIGFTIRNLAEFGVRPIYEKLLRLMVGMPPQFVEGRNGKWTRTDPRAFDPAWGVRARVGLGALSRQERMNAYKEMIGLHTQIIGSQGLRNAFTTPEKTALLLQDAAAEYRGLGAQRYFNTPDEAAAYVQEKAQQPPPPDPKMEEVKRRAAEGQAKLQADQQQDSARLELDRTLGAEKIAAERERNLLTHSENMYEMGVQVPLEVMKIKHDRRGGNGNIPRRMPDGGR